jgi:hypothetical protein
MTSPTDMENFVRTCYNDPEYKSAVESINAIEMTNASFPEFASLAFSGDKVAMQKIANGFRQKGIEAFGHTENARMLSFSYFMCGMYWSSRV